MIIVVGGGIAGLYIAKKLGATLITNNENFIFQPRIPEAIGGREKGVVKEIKYHRMIKGIVTKVDLETNTVYVGQQEYQYKYLILATGAQPAFMALGAKEFTEEFHSMEDVRKLRAKLPKHHIVVVGGGPTGVEIAMELASHGRVTLLNGGDKILPQFGDGAREYALDKMRDVGIVVETNARVDEVTNNSVMIKDRDKLQADLVIWCAGVRPNLVEGVPANKGFIVNEYLQVNDNVFAVGDCSESGAPMSAQAATQEAEIIVKNVRNLMKGKPLAPFKFHSKGLFLSLGKDAYMESTISLKGRLAMFIRNKYYDYMFSKY